MARLVWSCAMKLNRFCVSVQGVSLSAPFRGVSGMWLWADRSRSSIFSLYTWRLCRLRSPFWSKGNYLFHMIFRSLRWLFLRNWKIQSKQLSTTHFLSFLLSFGSNKAITDIEVMLLRQIYCLARKSIIITTPEGMKKEKMSNEDLFTPFISMSDEDQAEWSKHHEK